jgi:hypothetical protein
MKIIYTIIFVNFKQYVVPLKGLEERKTHNEKLKNNGGPNIDVRVWKISEGMIKRLAERIG